MAGTEGIFCPGVGAQTPQNPLIRLPRRLFGGAVGRERVRHAVKDAGASGMRPVAGRRLASTAPAGWHSREGGTLEATPLVSTAVTAMTVRGKKAAAVTPEERPDLLAIRRRHGEFAQGLPTPEGEASLAMGRWQGLYSRSRLKQKHQPMNLLRAAALAHHTRQMKLGRR